MKMIENLLVTIAQIQGNAIENLLTRIASENWISMPKICARMSNISMKKIRITGKVQLVKKISDQINYISRKLCHH